MEHTYYFSQGRMTYNKFKEPPRDIETGLMNATKDANATNSSGGWFLSNLWNFQLYNKSILRYK
jgi:hypothetical protein